MDFLPNELMIKILYECSYKSIINFTLTNKKFYCLDQKFLLDVRCKREFPRIEGKAKVHQIPNKIVDLRAKDAQPKITKEMLNNTMKYLINTEAEIIHGDIIIFDVSNCEALLPPSSPLVIFSNMNLSILSPHDSKLTKYFRVIENDTPIDYWHVFVPRRGNFKVIDPIYFDHNPVKDQCLTNLKRYDNIFFHTYFVFNDKKYYITCETHDENMLRKSLSSDELIPFQYSAKDWLIMHIFLPIQVYSRIKY